MSFPVITPPCVSQLPAENHDQSHPNMPANLDRKSYPPWLDDGLCIHWQPWSSCYSQSASYWKGPPSTFHLWTNLWNRRSTAFKWRQTLSDKFDVKIVAHVKYLIVVKNREIIDVDDSEEESESDPSTGLTLSDMSQMCKKLEGACWRFGYSETGLALPQELRHFRGFLRQMEMRNAKQSMLDSFWVK